jgi:hypothetical protein
MGMKRVLLVFAAGVISLLTLSPAWAAGDALPCTASAEARQLDYWLGDWAVASPGMAGKGHSTVHLSLDKCLMIESWGSDTSNHDGENTLAYNAEDKSWYGLFVDNHGRVHMMKGRVAPSAAEFEGPAQDENGAEVLKRVKVVRVNADNVEQIWEKSADNGATWTTEFRMEYLRKKP